MSTIRALTELLHRKKTIVTVLSCVVVFITTYILILPAITLDENEAAQQGGIDVPAQSQQIEDAQDIQSQQENQSADTQSEKARTNNSQSEKDAVEQADDTQQINQDAKATDPAANQLADNLSFAGKGYEVAMNCAEAGLPEGTQLVAEEISKSDEDYEGLYKDALAAVREESGSKVSSLAFAKFYDISLRSGEETIEPEHPVDVTISYDKALQASDADNIRIVHFAVDKKTGEISPEVLKQKQVDASIRSGKLTDATFEAKSFSVYAVVYAAEYEYLSADGKTWKFTVRYDADAGIPEDAQLQVKELKEGSDDYDQYLKKSAKKLGVAKDDVQFARFFDIAFVVDGVEVEPKTPVTVTAEYEDALELLDDQSLNVVHFADKGSEVISDVNLSRNGKKIGWEQDSFSVTGTIVTGGPRNGQQYMLVTEYEGHQYLINNDGTLIPVEDVANSNPAQINTDSPFLWTYYYNYGANFRFASEASGYNSDQTASGFYYRYLDPNTASGLTEEDQNQPDLHTSTRINYNNSRISSASNGNLYIGISDEGGTLHVVGNQSSGKAAQITLYSAEQVNSSDPANHTVNHIDISIEGSAQVNVPLAYGIYYYNDGGTWKKIIVGENVDDNDDGVELGARYTNKTESLVAEKVGISASDMKKATITAKDKNGNDVDNAFYITGYSANEPTEYSTQQVRIEGSFKVADIDPVYNWWEVNSDYTRARRLDNKITYTVTANKQISLPLLCEINGQKYQIYQSTDDTEGMTINAEVPMSASFDYWTSIEHVGNECPPLQPAWGYTDEWKTGGIHPWGISGMDFVLKADVTDVPAKITALEITKKVVDENGNTLSIPQSFQSTFEVYQDKPGNPNTVRELGSEVHNYGDYSHLHDKKITIGTNGIGHVYDYNVTEGMYYIKENRDFPDSFTINDQQYNYIKTEIKTEYVWRDNSYKDDDHPNTMHEKAIASSTSDLSSIPEVAGDYKSDKGEDCRNEFLVFEFYNVYKVNGEVPKPDPISRTLDIQIDKKWQDGETSIDPETVDGTVTFKLHQIRTQGGNSVTDPEGSGFPKTITVSASDGWKAEIPNLVCYESDTENTFERTYQYYLEEDTSKATGSAANYDVPSFTNGFGSVNDPVAEDNNDEPITVEVVNKTGNVLRIQKRWINIDPDTAPEVTIQIWRQKMDQYGNPSGQTTLYREVALNNSNRVSGQNWWQIEIPYPQDTLQSYGKGWVWDQELQQNVEKELTDDYAYYITEVNPDGSGNNTSQIFQDPRFFKLVGDEAIGDYEAFAAVGNGQGYKFGNINWGDIKNKSVYYNGKSIYNYVTASNSQDTTLMVMNAPKDSFDHVYFGKRWYKYDNNGNLVTAHSSDTNGYAIGLQLYQRLTGSSSWHEFAEPFYIASTTDVIDCNGHRYIMDENNPFKFNEEPSVDRNGVWKWLFIQADGARNGFPRYALVNGQRVAYEYEVREIGIYEGDHASTADQLTRVYDYANIQTWEFNQSAENNQNNGPNGINIEAGKLKVTKEWQGSNVGSRIYFHVFRGNEDITDDIVANYEDYGLTEHQVYDDGTHKALIVKNDGTSWEELLIQGLPMAPGGISGGTPYQYSIQEIGYAEADGTNCWDGEVIINSDGSERNDPHGQTVTASVSELLTGYKVDSAGEATKLANGRSNATALTGEDNHQITVVNKYEEKWKDFEITKIWTNQTGDLLTWEQNITVDLYAKAKGADDSSYQKVAENILLFVTPPDQQATQTFRISGDTTIYNWVVSVDPSGKKYTFTFKDLPAKISSISTTAEVDYAVVEQTITDFTTSYGTLTNETFNTITDDNKQRAEDGQVIRNMKPEESGVELPSAGGPGTTWIYLIGALLLLGCGITLVARRRTAKSQ